MNREAVISLGAGVQSSALLLMAADGYLDEWLGDTPRPRLAVFSDTEREPPVVYEWLERLRAHASGIEIAQTSAGDLLEDALDGFNPIPLYQPDERGRATPGQRQCTYQFKIAPIRSFLRRREYGPTRPVSMLIGISIDEVARVKPSGVRWCENRHPLVDLRLTREDCRRYVAERIGASPVKSACYFCPYKGDREFVQMSKQEPDLFALAVEADEAMRTARNGREQFVSRSLVPLAELPLLDADRLTLFDDSDFQGECEGMCGV